MLANFLHLYLYLAIITINIDVQNLPTKKHRVVEWINNSVNICRQDSLQKKGYTQTEGEIMEKIK